MLITFLFLCLITARITGYEINFCGYLEESEPEMSIWRTQDELLAIIQNRARIETDSSFQHKHQKENKEHHLFKWMAFYNTEWPDSRLQERCGGVLISDSAVLTAAQCLQRKNATAQVTSVTLGVHDIRNPGDSKLEIPVERIVIHEHFNRTGNLEYDVGIMFLREEINWTLSTKIRPICLPPRGETNRYTKATVTGWGFRKGDKEASILQQGDVTVYDQQICSHIFNRMWDSEKVFCIGSLNQESACKGDVGGPLISRKPYQLQHELIGIIGDNCASSPISAATRYTSVFTKITEDMMLDWIHDKLIETPSPAKIVLDQVTLEKYQLERTLVERNTALENARLRNFELERILEYRDEEKSDLKISLRERESELQLLREKESELERTLTERNAELQQEREERFEFEKLRIISDPVLEQVTTEQSELYRTPEKDIEVGADCIDNPYFANCQLIVKSHYCDNKYYAKFCCRSCVLAGQIPYSH